jgi:hypothetical protein
MNLQQLIIEQSLLIDKQNQKLKEILNNGIYAHDDVVNILTTTLVRIREKAELEISNNVYAHDEPTNLKIKQDILNAIWFSVSAVQYKDLLNR